MARSVPEPDSDSLKHRFSARWEKSAGRSLPGGRRKRQNLPRERKLLPSWTRQLIPLCEKQFADLPENSARKTWLAKS
jgi:hypothetical protein